MIDPGYLKVISDWVQLGLAGACGGGLALWASLGRRNRALSGQIDALTKEVHEAQTDQAQRLMRLEVTRDLMPSAAPCANHLERLTRLEEAVQHTAGTTELAAIYDEINPLRTAVASLSADMRGIGDALRAVREGLNTLTESILRRDEAHKL